MKTVLTLLLLFSALQHICFFVLESFLWTKPIGRRVFGLSTTFAHNTKSMATNQGVYNAFLTIALSIGLGHPDPAVANAFQWFSLVCIIVAGIVGGLTVSWKIFIVQGVPALIAIIILSMT